MATRGKLFGNRIRVAVNFINRRYGINLAIENWSIGYLAVTYKGTLLAVTHNARQDRASAAHFVGRIHRIARDLLC